MYCYADRWRYPIYSRREIQSLHLPLWSLSARLWSLSARLSIRGNSKLPMNLTPSMNFILYVTVLFAGSSCVGTQNVMPFPSLYFLQRLQLPFPFFCQLFHDTMIVMFQNGMNLKDYLVRATSTKLNKRGRCESCGEKTCFVCDSISIAAMFTTDVGQETFQIQINPWNCDSEELRM